MLCKSEVCDALTKGRGESPALDANGRSARDLSDAHAHTEVGVDGVGEGLAAEDGGGGGGEGRSGGSLLSSSVAVATTRSRSSLATSSELGKSGRGSASRSEA